MGLRSPRRYPTYVSIRLLTRRRWYSGDSGDRGRKYHVLDVQAVGIRHVQLGLGGANALVRLRVELGDHIGRLGGILARVNGLVHDLEHADVVVCLVGVDAVGHPLEELEGALVVFLVVELWVFDALSLLLVHLMFAGDIHPGREGNVRGR